MGNVILNIYDLVPEQQQQTSSLSNFFSGLLTPLGFGAYHTSIDVRGYRYQFGASVGIVRTSSPQGGGDTAESLRYVPPNGAYRESIVLGQTWFEQAEINAIIQRMREDKFKGDNYHLAGRNCNHFSETFAMALILGDELLDDRSNKKLNNFPSYVNRLAKTGTSFGIDDGTACDVLEEARVAAGSKGKVGWDLTSSSKAKNKSSDTSAKRSQKKELTEKQKALLAKLGKGGSK